MQGLVSYKPLAYKPTPTPASKPICQAIYLPPGQTDSPHLHQHIDKQESDQQGLSGVEPWRVDSWSFQGLVISTLSIGGEVVGRIWEVRVSTSKNIGWFGMELPYYHYYYYIIIIFM